MLSFHVKFVETDRQTDRQTTVKKYAPNLSMRGHKKGENANLPAFFLSPTIFSSGFLYQGSYKSNCAVKTERKSTLTLYQTKF